MSSATGFNLNQSKILSSGNGLKVLARIHENSSSHCDMIAIFLKMAQTTTPSFSILINEPCYTKRQGLTLSSIYTHFNTLKKKALGKHCGKM